MRPFVTISRQAGAGGHALADSLIVAFEHQDDRDVFGGWQVFDKELCDIVAEDPKYSSAFSALLAEEYDTKTRDFIRQIFGSTIDQDVLAHEVFRVVSAVASMGKCIILGRAGNEVTRGLDHRFSIRLIATEAVRNLGMGDYYGLDELAARREARRLDESRSRLLRSHFHVDIEDPTRYDVTWNTGQVSMNVMADSVVVAIKHIIATAQPASPK
ncbi:MAG: cytidylate kinase-like family protein [Acidimicrobiia bacterium]|nr:cytidylate kinase-like family protein [Acidimicrobiia bacterium]